MSEQLEKTYKELSKKHTLPDFSKLDREFQISTLEDDNFLLREIISIMNDKIDFYAMMINNLLHPDSGSLAPLHECRAFSDEQKESLFILYKVLMSNHRKGILAILQGDEIIQSRFINEFFKDWLKIKIQLLQMITRMQSSWGEQSSIKEELGYFG